MAKSFLFLVVAPLIFALLGCNSSPSSSTSTSTAQPRNTTDKVKTNLRLVCGVSGELPGFSFVQTDGKYAGIDVDVCRAVASALFDNPDKVEFRNLSAKERFTALQTGEIDLLSRNTTWTFSVILLWVYIFHP